MLSMSKYRVSLAALARISAWFVCLCLFVTASTAYASTRQALVIGNSDYNGRFSLVTPAADSTSIARKLSEIGYQVHGGGALLNLELDEFNREIDNFLASIEDGASTLFYYAGHGAASSGSNYLIPILPDGVTLRSESDIRDRSISLQGIVERVEQRNPSGVNSFFFDACRDAPVETFSRSINLTGLTNLDTARQPRGSFIGFSTEYGKVALDGWGTENSPFASAFLNSLEKSASSPIELFYKEVTEQVYDSTSGQQFPIQESKLRGEHCITDCGQRSTTGVTQEFGFLSARTTPEDAEVCYLLDGWDTWSCGHRVALPLNQPIEVRVRAKNHKTYTTTTQLEKTTEQIAIELEPGGNRTLKIVGGVAAVLVVGALLSSRSDSGSSDSGESEGEFSLTVVRP